MRMSSTPPLSFSWASVALVIALSPLLPLIDRYHAWQGRRWAARRDAEWQREEDALKRAGLDLAGKPCCEVHDLLEKYK